MSKLYIIHWLNLPTDLYLSIRLTISKSLLVLSVPDHSNLFLLITPMSTRDLLLFLSLSTSLHLYLKLQTFGLTRFLDIDSLIFLVFPRSPLKPYSISTPLLVCDSKTQITVSVQSPRLCYLIILYLVIAIKQTI